MTYERTRELAMLNIRNIQKSDAGQYHLTMDNVTGRSEFPFTINVYGKCLDDDSAFCVIQKIKKFKSNLNSMIIGNPGKIQELEIVEVNAESAVLKWSPPQNTGGTDITSYVVEKRESPSNNWISVNASCSRTMVKAIKLIQGNEYVFRIAAENKYGLGPFTESNEIVAKHPFR